MEIPEGNLEVIDGSTTALRLPPCVFPVNCSWVSVFLCLFNETIFKAFSRTVIHTNSPCKYVVIKILFDNFPLAEDSHFLTYLSLLLFYIVLGVDCLGLQEWFESWADVDIHKIKHYLSVFIKYEDVYFQHTGYNTFYTHAVCHHILSWCHRCD